MKLVRSYLGDFSNEIPEDYFDIVFSVSVVEHVAIPHVADFFRDIARILKNDGETIHAIDVYLVDPIHKQNKWRTSIPQRIDSYLQVDADESIPLKFKEPAAFGKDIEFQSDFASNSDREMHRWNKAVPELKGLRAIAQSVSLKAEWIKRA